MNNMLKEDENVDSTPEIKVTAEVKVQGQICSKLYAL